MHALNAPPTMLAGPISHFMSAAYDVRWLIVAVAFLALVILWTDEVLVRRAAEDRADRLQQENEDLAADLDSQTWKADALEVVVSTRGRSKVVALPTRRTGRSS